MRYIKIALFGIFFLAVSFFGVRSVFFSSTNDNVTIDYNRDNLTTPPVARISPTPSLFSLPGKVSQKNEKKSKKTSYPELTKDYSESFKTNLNPNELDSNNIFKFFLPKGMTTENVPEEWKGREEKLGEALEDLRDNFQPNEEMEDALSLSFTSNAIDPFYGSLDEKNNFSEYVGTIYAFWNYSNQEIVGGVDNILVKWFNQDHEVILFEYLPIRNDYSFNYMWRRSEYWLPGTYFVEFYDIKDVFVPLGKGSFVVLANSNDFLGSLSFSKTNIGAIDPLVIRWNDEIYLQANYAGFHGADITITVSKRSETTMIELNSQLDSPTLSLLNFKLKEAYDNWDVGDYWVDILNGEGAPIARGHFEITAF